MYYDLIQTYHILVQTDMKKGHLMSQGFKNEKLNFKALNDAIISSKEKKKQHSEFYFCLTWQWLSLSDKSDLTSIPLSGPVCVDSFRSAVPRTVNVFVFRAVRPPEDFAGRSDICRVPHLFMSMVHTRMALGWVFESL